MLYHTVTMTLHTVSFLDKKKSSSCFKAAISENTDDTTDENDESTGAMNIFTPQWKTKFIRDTRDTVTCFPRKSLCIRLVCGLITGISTFARVAGDVANTWWEISCV